MTSQFPSYRGYRFPAEIISHAVWLYHRFCLSFRAGRPIEQPLALVKAERVWGQPGQGCEFSNAVAPAQPSHCHQYAPWSPLQSQGKFETSSRVGLLKV